MRANAVITKTEGVAEMHHPGMSDAMGAAAIRVAEFVLWLLSAYLVFCFGLPRETFELVKEN
jgi:hypothetical protein